MDNYYKMSVLVWSRTKYQIFMPTLHTIFSSKVAAQDKIINNKNKNNNNKQYQQQ